MASILQTQWVRYALIATWAICLLPICGWKTGVGWFLATTAAGFGRSAVERRIARRPGPRIGWKFTLAAAGVGLLWAAAPVLAWRSGAPLGHGAALVFLACGYFLVTTQLRDRPAQAALVSSPYTLAAGLIAWDSRGGPLLVPYLASLAVLWGALLVDALFHRVFAGRLAAAHAAQNALIEELEAAREAAAAADRAKSVFLANVSHEIRTPLNGVIALAEALAKDPLPAVQHERAEVVRSSAASLLALLNDILDLSKIEAGKLDIEKIAFDLGEVVNSAVAPFRVLAERQGLALICDVASARGRYLGDPGRIRQIISNLTSNALKFTVEGAVRITASPSAEGVRLSVSDSGPGIAPDKLARLFERFDQLDSATSRTHGGTGLGLAICDELARLMGGAIAVESRLGVGTTFSLTLPLQRLADEDGRATDPSRPEVFPPEVCGPEVCGPEVCGPEVYEPEVSGTEASGPEVSEAQPSGAEFSGAELRVLAADDNATNRLVLKTLLAPLGIAPAMVEDGAAAVEACRTGAWDLILMDLNMPRMSGLEAVTMIRELEAASGRPAARIVALTADAMIGGLGRDEIRAGDVRAGLDGRLTKPIETAALYAAVAAALEAKEKVAAAPANLAQAEPHKLGPRSKRP